MTERYSKIDKNIYEFSGTVYLTAIALFQGIALALLLNYFVGFWVQNLDAKSLSELFRGRGRYFIFSGMAIFTIWHHYVYRILYLKWFPSIWDTIIPFSLGTFEILMILLLKHIMDIKIVSYWCYSASLLSFCGVAAYGHGIIIADPKRYPPSLLVNARALYKSLKIIYAIAAVVCEIMGISFFFMANKRLSGDWCYFILSLFFVHIIVYEFCHWLIIKPAFLEVEKKKELIRGRRSRGRT